MRVRCLLAAVVLLCAVDAGAAILRVDGRATGTPADGATWVTACRTLSDALGRVKDGDEIWVAAGTYTPGTTGRDASFRFTRAVAVYGGFAGDEESRDLRSPELNLTVLSGDLGQNDSESSTTHLDNSYHVVTVSGGTTVTLDGFEITAGSASGASADANGGGVRVLSSTLTLSGCVVEDNFAQNSGGGIQSQNSTLTLSDCRMANNRAGGGGGLFVNQGMASIARSFVMYNSADSAAGLYATSGATLDVENCVVADNTATGNGGGLSNNSGSVANVRYSTFTNNHAGTAGGAICNVQGSTTVSNSVFANNALDEIYNDDPADTCTVSLCVVQGGYAEGSDIIDADPRFRLAGGAYPYQINYDSPALNAASGESPPTDLRGVARPQNGVADMGAYEFDADTDEGGLPDVYEAVYGLDSGDPADDSTDLDGDGLSNLEEFRRNTQPDDQNDPPSHFYVDTTGSDTTGTGMQTAPWLTITHAMTNIPEGTAAFPITLHLGAGIFEEKVLLRAYTTLTGAGTAATTIQYEPTPDEPVVVTGAERSVLEGCTVTLPSETTAIVELLRIKDVSMRVSNVVFDGKDGNHVTGVFVTGVLSSNSLIRNCVIKRAEYGVFAVNSGVNITRNLFDSMLEGAIFIRPPEAKGDTPEQLPVMGSSDNISETGFNQFRQSSGFLVRNLTSGETNAQYNDWGVYSEAELEARFNAKSGAVRYQPYVGQSIIPGSVLIGVQDRASNAPIPIARNPLVKMGSILGTLDAPSSLFLFTTLPAGSYACVASAAGFLGTTLNIAAVAGDITATTLKLDAAAENEGEFAVEGDAPGVTEGEGGSEGQTEGEAGDQPRRRGCS